MCLTPLSENATFHSISKVRALRILFLIQLLYEREFQMKLIFEAFMKYLPFLFKLAAAIIFLFTWVSIVIVKIKKNDEYYCDHAHVPVATKQECLEWGGDWVKYKLNFSSLILGLLVGTIISTMEGWVYKMIEAMDNNGEGYAPSYNAHEHVQIIYVLIFFAGMIGVNFFVSIVLVNYRTIKQKLSGERYLNKVQKDWLGIKTYILSLQPEKPKRLPTNCFRRSLYQLWTHQAYKIFQGIIVISFLILSVL